MNMNQLINMAMRMLTRRAMNWGMNKGMNTLSRNGRGGAEGRRGHGQDKTTREAIKRARQAARITRRLGR